MKEALRAKLSPVSFTALHIEQLTVPTLANIVLGLGTTRHEQTDEEGKTTFVVQADHVLGHALMVGRDNPRQTTCTFQQLANDCPLIAGVADLGHELV